MNFEQYKLIISDLDGTLVEYGTNKISDLLKATIKSYRSRGVLFTIATGRSWRETQPIARELAVEIPVIIQAGAIVIDPVSERVLRTQPLRPEIELQLRKVVATPHVDRFCLGETGTYYATQVNTAGGHWLAGKSGEPCRMIEDWVSDSVIKHLFIGPEPALKLLSEEIYREVKPTPIQILWPPDQAGHDWFLEVFDPLASKGQALNWIIAQLGLDMKEVIAFGDGFNDLDLLKTAGLGVAMAEAAPVVIANADYVIPGPIQDGLARFLKGEPVGEKVS